MSSPPLDGLLPAEALIQRELGPVAHAPELGDGMVAMTLLKAQYLLSCWLNALIVQPCRQWQHACAVESQLYAVWRLTNVLRLCTEDVDVHGGVGALTLQLDTARGRSGGASQYKRSVNTAASMGGFCQNCSHALLVCWFEFGL